MRWVLRETWAKGPNAPRYVIEEEGTPRVVADVGNKADAQVIAAAPAMLELLRKVYTLPEVQADALLWAEIGNAARFLVRDAEGKP